MMGAAAALLPISNVQTLGKKLSSEFIGTFFLCFSIALSAGHGADLAPLAIGATLMVMIFALGHVSGAHFNPAVTVAVGIRGKIAWSEAIFYIIAQLIGAFVAGGVAYGVLNDFETCFAGKIPCKEGGYPSKPDDVGAGFALVVEAIWTFALVTVVLNTATTKAQENNSFFGLAIGLTVFAGAVSAGKISGGAFNPAVGTGLPAVHGIGKDIWIYWLGPMTGACSAALVFNHITADPTEFYD